MRIGDISSIFEVVLGVPLYTSFIITSFQIYFFADGLKLFIENSNASVSPDLQSDLNALVTSILKYASLIWTPDVQGQVG